MLPSICEVQGPPRKGDRDFYFSVHVACPHVNASGERCPGVAKEFRYPIAGAGRTTTAQAIDHVLDDICEWLNTQPIIQAYYRRPRYVRVGREIQLSDRRIILPAYPQDT